MRKLISLALLSLCAVASAIGLRHSSIRNTQWLITVKEGDKTMGHELICFTDSTYSRYAIYTETGMTHPTGALPYYLSDSIDTKFNESLVGADTHGSHLIIKVPNSNIPLCLVARITPKGDLRIIDDNCLTYDYQPSSQETADSLLHRAQQEYDMHTSIMFGAIRQNGYSSDSTLYMMADNAGGVSLNIQNMNEEKMGDIAALVICGPINSHDVYYLRTLVCGKNPRCPNLRTLDLSRAWTVTDTLFYDARQVFYTHEEFAKIRGPRNDVQYINHTLEEFFKMPEAKDIVHTPYGYIAEVIPDSLYIKFLTTNGDCLSEWMLSDMPYVTTLRLPEKIRHLYYKSIADCPSLREVTIPQYVRSADVSVFDCDSSLVKVRVSTYNAIPPTLRPASRETDRTAYTNCRKDLEIELYEPRRLNNANKESWDKAKETAKSLDPLRKMIVKLRDRIYRETDIDSIKAMSMEHKKAQMTYDRAVTRVIMENQGNGIGANVMAMLYRDMTPLLVHTLLCLTNDSLALDPMVNAVWDIVQLRTRPIHVDFQQYCDTSLMRKVHVKAAGTLQAAMSDEEWTRVSRLSVSGPLNSDDIKWLNSQPLGAIDMADAVIDALPSMAFQYNRHLEYIRLPKTLRHIGKYSFDGCRYLYRVDMNQGLRSIGMQAFLNALNLRSITLPESIDTIASYAFERCEMLQALRIPAKTRHIGLDITRGCPRVRFTIDPRNPHYTIKEGSVKGLTPRTREMQGQKRLTNKLF
ncbi:MAG: leucine-rich repeat domain-containing protein [Prevotellaceae bacterium]|nr:leucine-rich repeat domain-containing protein [Prevotellaceae bacterium]MDO4931394.1 leucine-rich repeat domain-containing protein [Prevotellaceae bacterium]